MLPVSLPASWPLQTLPTQEPRGGWKSLVREGFLATYLPASSLSPVVSLLMISPGCHRAVLGRLQPCPSLGPRPLFPGL